MKKIINGKAYDTDTAQKVAEWSNGLGYRDFSWIEETLYRKRTGEYFLFGEGGPMTRYAESCGSNSWSSGSRISPLSYRDAAAWAEEHLDADDYEAIFGVVIEDDTKRTVAYNLSVSAIEQLRRMSEAQARSASEILDELIRAAAARSAEPSPAGPSPAAKPSVWYLVDALAAGDMFDHELRAKTAEEALDEALREWDSLSPRDQDRRRAFYFGRIDAEAYRTALDEGESVLDLLEDIVTVK